ncbi:translation initiation factor IF-2 subunit gamma [Candidatus Woesearchaeota archaeon]|nr:translation initiation factor IF-2 subunit gamma [Candidatus Woesearchaeota archaeon]
MAQRKKAPPEKKKSVFLQPVINIGMVGHVDHGKTTLLERLSGKWSDTHSEEIKRGITIRLGYANTTFYKTKDGSYTTKEEKDSVELRKISFVDAPGHESLMATMLAGATIMDGALLLVAANEKCPQPQTREHLKALEISGIKNIVVVQNKIDLVSEQDAMKNYEQIKAFLSNTMFKDAPIIPISAQHRVGISALIEAIEKFIPTPERNENKEPFFVVARSFDINKPGTEIDHLVGGVLGGSLLSGKLEIGMDIEIRPGYKVIEKNQEIFRPLKSKIVGIKSANDSIESALPGGSLGILTALDPSVVKSDKLTGSVVSIPGKLPPVHHTMILEPALLDRVVGSEKNIPVEHVKMNEALMMNVNSASTVGVVTELKKGKVKCRLKLPVCANYGSRVALSRMVDNRFRLIGFGTILES